MSNLNSDQNYTAANLNTISTAENSTYGQPVSPIKTQVSPVIQQKVTWDLDNISTHNSNVNNEASECLGILGIFYGGVMILGAGVTVIVAAIFGLIGIINISNNRVKDICPKSSLWPFVLTWVIIVFGNLIIAKSQSKNKDKDSPLFSIVCALSQLTGLTIWGIIEIWFIADDCDKLQGKMIFLSAKIIVITYTVILGHIILGCVGMICYKCYSSSKNSKNSKSNDNTESYGV